MTDFSSTLATFDLLSELSSEECSKLAGIGKPVKIKKGEVLLKESDVGDTVFLILEGRLDVSVSLVNQERTEIIASVKPGDIVGESVLLGKKRRNAYVVAHDNVSALVFDTKDLNNLFESNYRIGYILMRNLAKDLAEKLQATNQSLRNLLTGSQIIT